MHAAFIESACERIRSAAASGGALRIRGGGSKDFYGCAAAGELLGDVLDTRAYAGIEAYDPSELVMTVRAGTALADVEAALAERGQGLPFEPPHFGAATVGGAVACGFSGPRRPWSGALRDHLLGATLMDGRGEVLRFGGQVMKNVAGFDLFRVQAGALGTLGLLLEVSFKVLPRAPVETTRVFECAATQAIETMNRHAGIALPLAGAAWHEGLLRLRLAGNAAAVRAAEARLGGAVDDDGASFWRDLREQQLPFFAGPAPLWRLAVRSTSAPFAIGDEFVDWGGAQRWLRSDAPADRLRTLAHKAGGHATLFRNGARSDVFQPLAPAVMALHRRLKETFDPQRVFTRGRLYPEL